MSDIGRTHANRRLSTSIRSPDFCAPVTHTEQEFAQRDCAILSAVTALPQAQRIAIFLHYYAGMSIRGKSQTPFTRRQLQPPSTLAADVRHFGFRSKGDHNDYEFE